VTEFSDTYRAYREWVSTPNVDVPAVSVIVPAYDEEWRILPAIGAIATYMCMREESWELIVCDDGSTDRTVDLVERLGFANLTLLRSDRNRGKGDAVRRGMLAARGGILLFTDADHSTPIEQFDALERRIFAGADIAVGSRAAAGAQVGPRSLVRRTLTLGLHLIASGLFGIGVKDTQCGFKMFTRHAARELFALQTMEGFSFDLEVLYLARRRGFTVAEVPVEWVNAPGSRVEAVGATALFLKDLVTIRLRDLRGVYLKRGTYGTDLV
jgi:dolichyl-phosphate beta-glucosyltransferase